MAQCQKNQGRLAQDMKRELIAIIGADEGPAPCRRPAHRHARGGHPGPGSRPEGVRQRAGPAGRAPRPSTALNRAAGHVRSEIAKRMHIRKAPALPRSRGRRRGLRRSHQRDAGGLEEGEPMSGTTGDTCGVRERAVSRLLQAENILLLCHKNPDGDTLGSAAALYHALEGWARRRRVLCADPIPPVYATCSWRCIDGQFEPGYVVAVDVASIQLFGDGVPPLRRAGGPVHRPPRLQQRATRATTLYLDANAGRHRRDHLPASGAPCRGPRSPRSSPTACTPACPPTPAASSLRQHHRPHPPAPRPR